MINELKNFFYVLVIFFFIFFTIKYYFSDSYKKKSYRTLNLVEKNIKNTGNLLTLKSDTDNIIELITNITDEKKKYNFWKLLTND